MRAQFGSDSFIVNADYFMRATDNIEIPGYAESKLLRELEEAEGGGEEGEEAFGRVENTDSDTSGGAVGFSLVGDSGFAGISVSGFDSEYGVPGHHHDDEEAVRIDLDQTRVDAKGEYDFNGNVLDGIRFRAAVNDYKHTEFEGDEVGTVFDVQGTDGRLEFRHAQWGNLEGAIGFQYKRIDFDAIGDEAFVPASDTKQVSLFLFEELSLSDTWVLQASARLEDQSISGSTLLESYDGDAFGASLGTIWRPTDVLRVSANIALTERHPTTTELYADGPHIAAQRYERGSVTLGDGILKKEESTNLDLTLHGDTNRVEWSISAFMNSVDDYILLRPTALELDELPVYDFAQANVEFTGVEAEALVELFDEDGHHLHLRVFADFVNAEEDATGANLPRIPPRRLGLGLHGGWDGIDASLDMTFADDQDDVAINELPTEGYTLLNASISYTFAESGLLLFLRGSNLLDEDIRQHTSPLKELIPLPGRSLHAGLRYEF
jgi:iron complex outermembrane receptor protein